MMEESREVVVIDGAVQCTYGLLLFPPFFPHDFRFNPMMRESKSKEWCKFFMETHYDHATTTLVLLINETRLKSFNVSKL